MSRNREKWIMERKNSMPLHVGGIVYGLASYRGKERKKETRMTNVRKECKKRRDGNVVYLSTGQRGGERKNLR